jgi:hypothetical protein
VQLAQARELEAKLVEEYRVVRLLHASIAEEASARGERACELGKQARERINVDFDIDNPNTPPPRHCYGPCPLPQRPRCETYTARCRSHRASGRATGRELSVSHPPVGERAGRRGRTRPRSVSTHGRRGGAARQPRAHAGQGADP